MPEFANLQSLQIVRSLDLADGGPPESVMRLSEALCQCGNKAEIATLGLFGPGHLIGPPETHVFKIHQPYRLGRSPGFRDFVLGQGARFDVIHAHGVWTWTNFYGRRSALRHGKPLVISPRGSVEAWSLAQKWVRKRIGWMLWERKNFESAALFHATSEQEAESIRRLGVCAPIAIIPNGVKHPVARQVGPTTDRRHLLFLSRLHAKKGLDILVEAWRQLWARYPNWQLVIVGPDGDGYGAALALQAKEQGIPGTSIQFLPPHFGEKKWQLYRDAELFILPSHSENFGNVIAEALSQGIPVLTTQGTPWQVLEEKGCGWWIETGLNPLVKCLDEVLRLSPEILAQAGRRGQALILERFSWQPIAQEFLDCYRWLRQPTLPRPSVVHLD